MAHQALFKSKAVMLLRGLLRAIVAFVLLHCRTCVLGMSQIVRHDRHTALFYPDGLDHLIQVTCRTGPSTIQDPCWMPGTRRSNDDPGRRAAFSLLILGDRRRSD